MLEKKMECVSMVLMAEMTEFMKQDIILQDIRKTDDIEIKIDVPFCRTAAPIGSIMLDRYAAI
jgi:hypothetical protein